jgi:hypothetical protein
MLEDVLMVESKMVECRLVTVPVPAQRGVAGVLMDIVEAVIRLQVLWMSSVGIQRKQRRIGQDVGVKSQLCGWRDHS